MHEIAEQRDDVAAGSPLPLHRLELLGRVSLGLHPLFGEEQRRVPKRAEDEGDEGGDEDGEDVDIRSGHGCSFGSVLATGALDGDTRAAASNSRIQRDSGHATRRRLGRAEYRRPARGGIGRFVGRGKGGAALRAYANTSSATSTRPKGALTWMPCTAPFTCWNFSRAIATPAADAVSFPFSCARRIRASTDACTHSPRTSFARNSS